MANEWSLKLHYYVGGVANGLGIGIVKLVVWRIILKCAYFCNIGVWVVFPMLFELASFCNIGGVVNGIVIRKIVTLVWRAILELI